MKPINCLAFLFIFFSIQFLSGQKGILSGTVTDETNGWPLPGAIVSISELNQNKECGSNGQFEWVDLPYGTYTIVVFLVGKNTWQETIVLSVPKLELKVKMSDLSSNLNEVTVLATGEKSLGITRLNAVEGAAIYEGKKSEVVLLDDIQANLATNNPRQLFAKIAGLNIWESDGAGLQLGIGGRGLSPNRTSNFNTRQNGYDISADALGYPESYYTPPTEALERIEVVRGAASLQYGTQFGGMINFVFRKPEKEKLFHFLTRQTVGSFGYFSTFNNLSGTTKNQAFSYYAFYQYKKGDGWRDNSNFDLHNGFLNLEYKIGERWKIGAEITKMNYLAQQPGGLTDVFFEQNPRQSIRERNWFQINWNLFALHADYRINDRTRLNIRNFALIARRQALGNLSPINNIDFGGNRDLIDGQFKNLGNETRLIHRYRSGQNENTALIGMRLYKGTTTARQGEANSGSGSDFQFLNPENVEKSDYRFPNFNWSLFAENIFYLSSKLTLTPGIRFENIQTFAEGYFKQRVFDAAGNLVAESRQEESLDRKRAFIIMGLGLSYKFDSRFELYSNFSQNYRAINFTDLRIDNPNGRVDPGIEDERGYTADIGLRGRAGDLWYLDFTAFYLAYKDRIGLLLRADEPPLYNDYRLRTNISDARNAGIELFSEFNLWKWLSPADSLSRLSIFVNAALIDARYINTSDNSIKNKKVELVAPLTLRTGCTFQYRQFNISGTIAYTGEHYTDATNSRRTASAVNGVIPAYTVADLTVSRAWKKFKLEMSCNNLLDARYFTRRAEAYPGPGIIPADGRSFFCTVQYRL